MSLAVVPNLSPHTRSTALEENDMTAPYTFDVFSSLDGYGSVGPGANWGGYWRKQGPELLDHRLACTTRSSGWSSGPTPIEHSRGCWPRAPRNPKCVTHGSPG
jgi:hypothetical protein